MYEHISTKLLSLSQFSAKTEWTVSLVMADEHFNLPWGFPCVCMGHNTHFITPNGKM